MKIQRKERGEKFVRQTFGYSQKAVDDTGMFEGYASVFNNVDSGADIVAPGAFADSIKELQATGDPLPILWQHRSDLPIGGADPAFLKEDDHGLFTRGNLLIPDVRQAVEAHALMKKRIVKGLSIGYWVLMDSWNEKTGVRTLLKLDLVEYSVVTFPMNELATVDTVKQLAKNGKLPTMKAFEGLLRDAGFSISEAKHIAGYGLRSLLNLRDAGDPEELPRDVDEMKAALSVLKNFKLS